MLIRLTSPTGLLKVARRVPGGGFKCKIENVKCKIKCTIINPNQ